MTSKVNNYSLTQSDWCWWAAIIIKANSSNNNYNDNDGNHFSTAGLAGTTQTGKNSPEHGKAATPSEAVRVI